ncbi:hypothetical protein [Domibacillus mangrovi]|uniref:Uncharacterized protein n=1 Tax=Domibacillus mangrovi TaxID=1714354 RepID=A0A1Q5P424_9BACI|nr:hypothetical protein [Domibacillus mangrovi]OKL36996.1 hypothetical protein BLL40_05235 [Domibacillus mangrovi]
MVFSEIDAYLHSLFYTDAYTELPADIREKIAFTAEDMLINHYDEALLTPKIIGIQTLYMIEGEAEEFAKFKRHGVKSLGLKGMSFSFEGGNISPEVVALIEKAQAALQPKKRASARRLI